MNAAAHSEPGHASHATLARRLEVSIVTPEGLAFEGPAAHVVVPGHDGEVAFYPLHAAFVGALGYGELRVAALEGGMRRWFLEGGVAEVGGDRVTVLAERTLAIERIDVPATRRELAQTVASVPADEAAAQSREHRILSAQARLRVAGATSAAPTPPGG